MINGILPIYKEKNMTSHDVVFKLRKILKIKKIGHAGTLDPDVEGILLILIGDSTKVSDYAMNLGKKYRAEICLGMSTTTEDLSGDIVSEKNVENVPIEEIKKVTKKLIGKIEQKPPIYSAVKVNGKKLYEYARLNKFDVEIPKRIVTINSIDIDEKSIHYSEKKCYFTVDISCGKGTYIRTIATQIGEMLNLPSCMSKLTRIATGDITITDTYTLDYIKQNLEKINSILLPKEYALKNYKFYEVPKYRAQQIQNGLRFRKNQFEDTDFENPVVFTYKKKAIGIYYLKDKSDELLTVKNIFPTKIE